MPLTAIVSSISSEHVAGPMVATILVRRVLLKPGNTHQSFTFLVSVAYISIGMVLLTPRHIRALIMPYYSGIFP